MFGPSTLTKGARITLGFDNLFNARQDVRNQTGITPLGYQPIYRDPLGRIFDRTSQGFLVSGKPVEQRLERALLRNQVIGARQFADHQTLVTQRQVLSGRPFAIGGIVIGEHRQA